MNKRPGKPNPAHSPSVSAMTVELPPLFRWYEISGMLLLLSVLLATLASGSLWAADAGAEIERKNEGRLFYTTIRIPANAETLYVSGAGASMKEDGTWGNMEEQAVNIFTKFKATLEGEGWSMSDIVQVRVFAIADEYGLLDFEGFNRGYLQFFGTEANPAKPVRSFVQVADLVAEGWLVEVEIRAARVPE